MGKWLKGRREEIVPAAAQFTFLGLPGKAALAPPHSEATRTVALPRGRTFTLPVRVHGDDVALRVFFRSPLGDYTSESLGSAGGTRGSGQR